jgi:hypothetical protein
MWLKCKRYFPALLFLAVLLTWWFGQSLATLAGWEPANAADAIAALFTGLGFSASLIVIWNHSRESNVQATERACLELLRVFKDGAVNCRADLERYDLANRLSQCTDARAMEVVLMELFQDSDNGFAKLFEDLEETLMSLSSLPDERRRITEKIIQNAVPEHARSVLLPYLIWRRDAKQFLCMLRSTRILNEAAFANCSALERTELFRWYRHEFPSTSPRNKQGTGKPSTNTAHVI